MADDHTEYEGRVLNVDKASVQQRLTDLGAELVAKKNYRRYVFNTMPAVKNRWVRLRTDGQKTKLTVKEITKATVDGVQEWETVVDDFETTLAMLEKMGAIIEGAGSPTISITGVPRLCGATHSVMPDRIEAGTWITAALASRGKVLIRDAQKKYLGSFLDVLERAECPVKAKSPSSIYVDASDLKLRPIEAITLPYPGLPTDLQAQLCALMTQADGISIVTERIYPERFMHVPELARMGANIAREGPSAIISGGTKLSGAPVMASDLRASAALVIAALAASGETLIHRVYHIDRGYEKIDEKLASLGARVERLKGAE